ncbi:MAG: helix-turn-helix domain-containing protein [Clostridiales bacterium]|nr:helix-turn-helix domain-containing protein [Clostridiales bacterium]
MQYQNSNVCSLSLTNALLTKPSFKLDFINNIPLEWQIVYSYTYTTGKNIDRNVQSCHEQNYHEIILHLTSGRRFFAHTSLYEPMYGDIIIFPANVIHRGINMRIEPYERYYIYINPLLMSYMPDSELIKRCFDTSAPTLVRLPQKRRDHILSEFTGFRNMHEFSKSEQFRLRNTIMQLLYELAVGENSYPPPADKLSPLLTKILKYIEGNYKTIQTSADIAAHFSISESYMSRLFRESLRQSPYQYLQNMRLIESKRLLNEGMSVTEACFESGFNDCSHFIAYFKRCTDVTPSAYKNKQPPRI